jgi:predicted transcriptional regulator
VKSRKKRKPYSSINSDTRRTLLSLVKDNNSSIKEAAQQLNINYSTAKTILQLFRRTGRIEKIDKPDCMFPTQDDCDMESKDLTSSEMEMEAQFPFHRP